MADKTCKFTMYVNEPYGGGPEAWGHVYISLTDAQGVERVFGFHADSFMYGKDKVPPEDQIDGLKDSFKRVSGRIVDDSAYKYTEKETYAITQEGHDRAMELVKKWQTSPPKYILALNNCVTFLSKVARAAGVTPPVQVYGFPTPAGTAKWIRFHRRIKDSFGKTDAKLIAALDARPANDAQPTGPRRRHRPAAKPKLPGLFGK